MPTSGVRFVNNNGDYTARVADMPPIWGVAQTDGLILALRPRASDNSLIDLSASNATITKKGTVSYTANAVAGDRDNGLMTTVAEPLSYTMLVTCRLTATSDWAATGDLPAAGTWTNATGSDTDRGGLLGFAISAVAGGNATLKSSMRHFLAGGTFQTLDISSESISVGTRSSSWRMLAIQVNAANEQIIRQRCGNVGSIAVYQGAAGALSTRLLANPTTGITTKFEVGSVPLFGLSALGSGAKAEVAEILVFNTVLSQQTIDAQYALTKAGMLALGLTLA